MMTQYIAKINTVTYAGKSYDDTLSEEGTLWDFAQHTDDEFSEQNYSDTVNAIYRDDINISEDVIAYWGDEYMSTPEMYDKLERRKSYYTSKLPNDIDLGTEVLIRQICILEVSIAKDSAAGRSIDKSVNSLNTLLGSLNLKPTQKRDDGDSAIDNTPFGVWIRRWENQRPIPEPDPELQDVDGIVKYISIWFLGHLCKMLGIKNTYCKLYEDELAKMRIERPEYEDEDDEAMFNDIFGSDCPDDNSE